MPIRPSDVEGAADEVAQLLGVSFADANEVSAATTETAFRSSDPAPNLTKPVRRGDYLAKSVPLGTLVPKALVAAVLRMMQLHRALLQNHIGEATGTAAQLATAILSIAQATSALDYAAQLERQKELEPGKAATLQRYLTMLKDTQPAPVSPRRGYAALNPSPLNELARHAAMLNPLSLSGSAVEQAIIGVARSVASFKPPSAATINAWRARVRFTYDIREHNGTGKGRAPGPRSGRPWPMPCIPPAGATAGKYVLDVMINAGAWNLIASPLYLFHAQAWAQRIYVNSLERVGNRDTCPFFAVSTTSLKAYNVDEHDVRYLVEAYRKLHSLYRLRGNSLHATGLQMPFYEPRKTDDEVTWLWLKYAHRHHEYLSRGHSGSSSVLHLGHAILSELDNPNQAELDFRTLHRMAALPGEPLDEARFRAAAGMDPD